LLSFITGSTAVSLAGRDGAHDVMDVFTGVQDAFEEGHELDYHQLE